MWRKQIWWKKSLSWYALYVLLVHSRPVFGRGGNRNNSCLWCDCDHRPFVLSTVDDMGFQIKNEGLGTWRQVCVCVYCARFIFGWSFLEKCKVSLREITFVYRSSLVAYAARVFSLFGAVAAKGSIVALPTWMQSPSKYHFWCWCGINYITFPWICFCVFFRVSLIILLEILVLSL